MTVKYRYVRTKEGVYELQETKNGEKYLARNGELIPLWNTEAYEIIAQADNLYDLIQDGDLLEMNNCLLHRTVIADVEVHRFKNDVMFLFPGTVVMKEHVFAWWIQLPNGDFHKVAEKNDKGDLELL